MGKTGDLFKKIRDTKGTFHAKMGTIKARNGMDWTEAEDMKKRWQEYTEELYKKDLHDPDNHDGVITHLEPDILEFKVKWALGSTTMNTASESDGIPVEIFQILKGDTVKVLHSICQNLENSAAATGLEKVSFHSNPKEEWCQRMFKWKWSRSVVSLCDPMDCSPPVSSIHGIFRARILEWVTISFSRGSSRPRDRTWVSCIIGRCFTIWATREVQTTPQLHSSHMLAK